MVESYVLGRWGGFGLCVGSILLFLNSSCPHQQVWGHSQKSSAKQVVPDCELMYLTPKATWDSKELCSLSYTTDNAIQQAQSMGRGTSQTKIDMKKCFTLTASSSCQLPPAHDKTEKVTIYWYLSPFEFHFAPKLCNVLADLLSWILGIQGVSPIMHYLHNFITLAPPNSILLNRL